MKKVLVLDSNQRSALAVTRSLGKQGVHVFTAEETSTALASASCFSKQHFTYPSPRSQPEQFIKRLGSLVEKHHIDILLPMTELTTLLLLMNHDSFPETHIPFADLTTVKSLSDKCLLMKTAQSLKIPVPKTWYVEDRNKLSFNLEDVPYPIVLKPGNSWLFHQGQWSRAAVRFANNPAEAKHILDSDWAFKDHPFMIQETIAGHGAGVFAIYNKGKALAFFAHKRLREKPPGGGVSVLSQSVSIDPAQQAIARQLLDTAKWHGVAMVEFKVSPDDTPYLMEINTRFWGSLQLAIDAGVDFPAMLFQLACDKQTKPVTDYKIGIKLRWLLGDLDNLYLTLRDKHTPAGVKLKSIMDFITPSPFSTRHEVNRIGDMKPFWYEIRQYFRDLRG